MPDTSRRKLRRATVIYWMLLVYIIAALVWWFISLEKQNIEMSELKIMNLQATSAHSASFTSELETIREAKDRNISKYVGEGVTFLILILIGAAFVYQSVRRQFRTQIQQQNFMMAVTHELKTPVSVARLNLETMQKYSLEEEKQKKLIRMTLEELSRLNFLTNNILIASQLEGGAYENAKEELDMTDLLHDCIQDFRNRFPDRHFSESIQQEVEVKGDPLLLQLLINNLLENAIKYSPREKLINASLVHKNGNTVLQVSDEGPGIAEEEKKKIFNKFYRIGNETTRKTQGTGLGLFLCRIIARAHNADISVTNNTPSGSNFIVTFHD